MKNRYKIAIVCQSEVFLKVLATMIHHIGFPVKLECNSSNELISNLDIEDLPDLLLLYEENDREKNEAVITQLCTGFPSMQILIMTNNTNNDAINNLIVKGAKGFVYTHAASREVKHAIKKIMKHKIYYPDSISQITGNDMRADLRSNNK